MSIVNITVNNDADFYRVFRYQTISGVPIDITGASFVMMLRRRATDDVAVMKLGTDPLVGGMSITDAPNGQFAIWIYQADLERLGLGEFEHSNVMTLGTLKTNIWTGTFINNAGAAR